MINPIYPKLRDRLRRLEIEISIPCRHGWRWAHCDRDDEGSHVSDTDGTSELRDTDDCYCGQAVQIALRLELVILAHRIRRLPRRLEVAARRRLDRDLAAEYGTTLEDAVDKLRRTLGK